MKPRNNCGFERAGVEWVIIRHNFNGGSAEMTYAPITANHRCSLAAESSPATDVSGNRLPTNPYPGANGSALGRRVLGIENRRHYPSECVIRRIPITDSGAFRSP